MSDNIKVDAKDCLSIIPKFDGDQSILNLFIRRSEYILSKFDEPSNPDQTEYLFYCITSRLRGAAAALCSAREDLSNWAQLKEAFIQHFGDPRSEEYIAVELENLKIKQGESYLHFYNRIQELRSVLFSKANLNTDESVKSAKTIIYNNMCLNVFMYNLPEDIFRIVRMKKPTNLETALSVAMEEINFQFQYRSKNRVNKYAYIPDQNFKFGIHSKAASVAQLNALNQSGLYGQEPKTSSEFGSGAPAQVGVHRFGNENVGFSQSNGLYGAQSSGLFGAQSGGPNQIKFGMPQQNQAQMTPLNLQTGDFIKANWVQNQQKSGTQLFGNQDTKAGQNSDKK